MQYTPTNWYWIAENGRIYSSAKQAIITSKDDAFIKWQASGYLPTPWPKDAQGQQSDAALAEVIAPFGLKLFPKTLDDVKLELQTEVDKAAENERLKYITDGVGQSMTYQEKVNQAAEYSKKFGAHQKSPDDTPEPKEDDYLLLKASLGIDGSTLIEVAETVTHAYAIWQQIGAAIEATRLETKSKISTAKDITSAKAVFAELTWPNPC